MRRVLKLWPVWAGPMVLLGPGLLTGRVLFWGTPALQFVSWWWQIWQQVSSGQWPLWNPLNGMGAPLLANYQTAFFYPPNWLLLPLAGIFGVGGIAWGYSLLAMLHLIWAGLGMSWLLERLKFGWLAQVLGGLSFGLAGFIVGRLGFFSMVWAAAWLPWIIYFASGLAFPGMGRLATPWRFQRSIGLAAAISMLLLAGHAQLAWYCLLLTGAWVLWGAWEAGGVKLAVLRLVELGVAVLVAVVTAAVQLIPTFFYLQSSQRADEFGAAEAMRYSFWPWRVISLFSPDFFGNPGTGDYWGYATYWEDHAYPGLVIMLLALASLVILIKGFWPGRRSARWSVVAFGWLVLVVTFVLALGNNTPIFPFLYAHVPTFDMFQAPARYLLWASFILPLLAAVASERWRSPTGRGLYWFRLATAGAFAITLGAVIAWVLMRDVRLTFVRATALTGILGLGVGLMTLAIPYAIRRGLMNLWNWAVVGWLAFDLLIAGWLLNPLVDLDFYQPAREVDSTTYLQAGDGRIYLDPITEYDLKFRRFLQFNDFRPTEDWHNQRAALLPNLNLLEGVASANNFDPLLPGRYARWMAGLSQVDPREKLAWFNLMNVTVLEHIDVSQAGGVRFDISGIREGYLGWYGCEVLARDEAQAWQLTVEMLASGDPDNQQPRRLIIEQNETAANQTGGEKGQCDEAAAATFSPVQRNNGKLSFAVTTNAAGWVFLSESYDRGWAAQIDDQPASVVPAFSAFMAVPVEAGKHQVVLTYRPFGFYFGGLFSILGLLYLMITANSRYAPFWRNKSSNKK
jgi:hypothetical protein